MSIEWVEKFVVVTTTYGQITPLGPELPRQFSYQSEACWGKLIQ
jgi:hypothetical protein